MKFAILPSLFGKVSNENHFPAGSPQAARDRVWRHRRDGRRRWRDWHLLWKCPCGGLLSLTADSHRLTEPHPSEPVPRFPQTILMVPILQATAKAPSACSRCIGSGGEETSQLLPGCCGCGPHHSPPLHWSSPACCWERGTQSGVCGGLRGSAPPVTADILPAQCC